MTRNDIHTEDAFIFVVICFSEGIRPLSGIGLDDLQQSLYFLIQREPECDQTHPETAKLDIIE